MQTIIGWTVLGLVAGLLVHLLTPRRDVAGFVLSGVLGMSGAVLGGTLGRLAGVYGPAESGAGLVMAAGGAALMLFVRRMASTATGVQERSDNARERSRT